MNLWGPTKIRTSKDVIDKQLKKTCVFYLCGTWNGAEKFDQDLGRHWSPGSGGQEREYYDNEVEDLLGRVRYCGLSTMTSRKTTHDWGEGGKINLGWIMIQHLLFFVSWRFTEAEECQESCKSRQIAKLQRRVMIMTDLPAVGEEGNPPVRVEGNRQLLMKTEHGQVSTFFVSDFMLA